VRRRNSKFKIQNANVILFAFCILNFAFAASAATWLDRFKRDSNSTIATRKGVKAYSAKQYGAAAEAFTKANAYKSSPASLFNLGTARIAAGKREEGSAALTQAMADGSLRADALYNRGNSALAANAYDYAIRDYTASLKIRPADLQTKRNLEIALQRKAQAQQSQSGGQQKNPQGSQPQRQKNQQQQPGAGKNQQQPQQQQNRDANADALLRAVQQQEQEERSRMKRAKMVKGRVGW
jgi:Ca-activated chloride channel family protein